MRKDILWSQHAIMLRRTSMGLNNSLICLALFYALLVGDLLFIVSYASPQWIILKQRGNQLHFDASMRSILIS